MRCLQEFYVAYTVYLYIYIFGKINALYDVKKHAWKPPKSCPSKQLYY